MAHLSSPWICQIPRLAAGHRCLRGMGVPLMGPPPPEVAHRFRAAGRMDGAMSWAWQTTSTDQFFEKGSTFWKIEKLEELKVVEKKQYQHWRFWKQQWKNTEGFFRGICIRFLVCIPILLLNRWKPQKNGSGRGFSQWKWSEIVVFGLYNLGYFGVTLW